jgi:hypothetical protein
MRSITVQWHQPPSHCILKVSCISRRHSPVVFWPTTVALSQRMHSIVFLNRQQIAQLLCPRSQDVTDHSSGHAPQTPLTIPRCEPTSFRRQGIWRIAKSGAQPVSSSSISPPTNSLLFSSFLLLSFFYYSFFLLYLTCSELLVIRNRREWHSYPLSPHKTGIQSRHLCHLVLNVRRPHMKSKVT